MLTREAVLCYLAVPRQWCAGLVVNLFKEGDEETQLINPRRACAAKVTVLCVCICVSVCLLPR